MERLQNLGCPLGLCMNGNMYGNDNMDGGYQKIRTNEDRTPCIIHNDFFDKLLLLTTHNSELNMKEMKEIITLSKTFKIVPKGNKNNAKTRKARYIM
jgi:hypothetical protein